MIQQKQKIDSYDTIRALAMISVVFVHNIMPLMKMSYGRDMDAWWVGNIIISLFRIGVPSFLLLSGATMLVRDYKISEYIQKRFVRVLLPFLFWALAYIVYRWLILSGAKQPHGFEEIYPWLKNLCFNERISYHFWYIYMILILYILLPFVGKVLRVMSEKFVLAFLIVWLLINFVFMFPSIKDVVYDNILPEKLIKYFRFFGYMILGYYLRKKSFVFKGMRWWSGVVYLVLAAFMVLSTYYLSKSGHKLNMMFLSNRSPIVIIQMIALYFLFTNVQLKNKILIFLRDTISGYSYGIYLVHIMVMGVFYLNGIFWTMAHPLISLPALLILVLVTSTLIIYLLRKIPGGKHISG